jgi:hypothetical protein
MTMTDAQAAFAKASSDLAAASTKMHDAFKAHSDSQHALEEVSAAYDDARNRVAQAMSDIHEQVDKP